MKAASKRPVKFQPILHTLECMGPYFAGPPFVEHFELTYKS